jgi:hypothetical protein
MAAQGASCQRAWAYMRDANGGNGLTNLAAMIPPCSANTTAPAWSSRNSRKSGPPDPPRHPSLKNYEGNPIRP